MLLPPVRIRRPLEADIQISWEVEVIMAIQMTCPRCGSTALAKDESAGKKGTCGDPVNGHPANRIDANERKKMRFVISKLSLVWAVLFSLSATAIGHAGVILYYDDNGNSGYVSDMNSAGTVN